METPSARLLAAAVREFNATDADGRILTMRRPCALDRLRLFKAIGSALSQNAPYLGMALLASSVTSIDGVPVPPPVTEDQLEALVERLGDAGISAAADALEMDEKTECGRAEAGN